ncbi:MAG: aspartate carbamoyltransferase [Chloroflexi bacterium]|nr:aspartate carbamoyltransferase [Chloroflexota bacterium]|tara:strand:- start:221 stop:1231 length:1011 start_codon:yes stop_codon:yes gene_type:complete
MTRVGDLLVKEPSSRTILTRKHVIDLDDFAVDEIEYVFSVTDAMKEIVGRDIKKAPSLRGKTIVTLFYQPSTRTRVSFEQAAKILNADVINVSEGSSSVAKGEALINTVETLQALAADVVIVRHPHAGVPNVLARNLERMGVINAGDGMHAHPTQALVDLYTLRNHMGSLAGKKIVIVGDILHSRVVRSNLWGLVKMGAEVTLCGPPAFLPLSEAFTQIGGGNAKNSQVRIETSLEVALDGADAVMALRVQSENHGRGGITNIREYIRLYQLDARRIQIAKPDAIIMHPGPVQEGIEVTTAVARGSQSVISEQVTNGVAVRMALLYLAIVRNEATQ